MDETKFLATEKTTLISSGTDEELERTLVLGLYGDANKNTIDNDDGKQDASDVGTGHPPPMTLYVDIRRDIAEPDDEHVLTRRCPERSKVTPRRSAFAARKILETDTFSVGDAIYMDERNYCEGATSLELKTFLSCLRSGRIGAVLANQ